MWEVTKQSRSRYAWLWVLAISISMIAASIAWYILRIQSDFYPVKVRHNATLSLFYPTTLPDGYKIKSGSIQQTGDVVSYAAVNDKKQYINFSLQPRAEKFDFNTFYTTTLTKTFKFVTPYGEATIGSMSSNGNTVGSLIDGETWLIVSAPVEVKPTQLQTVISSLAIED